MKNESHTFNYTFALKNKCQGKIAFGENVGEILHLSFSVQVSSCKDVSTYSLKF